MKKAAQITLQKSPINSTELYDKYAGMLLGYIFEIVKDIELAEQHLINLYASLPQHFNNLSNDDCNTWCQLQRLARKQLSGYFDVGKKGYGINESDIKTYYERNKYIALMTCEQQQIFCSIYYRGKTVAQLSEQLNQTQEAIRRVLKEAFMIIKERK